MPVVKVYKYKLRPNARFITVCESALEGCRELYNGVIRERREAYRMQGVSINYRGRESTPVHCCYG